jgi:hypothetical protein
MQEVAYVVVQFLLVFLAPALEQDAMRKYRIV